MYRNYVSFRDSILACDSHYANVPAWAGNYKTKIDAAWGLYRNACQAQGGFQVCGRTRIGRADRTTIKGSSIEEIDLFNLGATNHDSSDYDARAPLMGKGAVLHYNEGWHFLLNDSWLLGGIHAGNEFHLASPRTEDNVWAPNKANLTVTGRELLGLNLFGYSFQKLKFTKGGAGGFSGVDVDYGEIAVCITKYKAHVATFEQYTKAVSRAETTKVVHHNVIDRNAVAVDPSSDDLGKWQVPFGPQMR